MNDEMVTLVVPMSKTKWIQIRTDDEVKLAIDNAAKKQGRTVSNWLLWLAAQADGEVAKAVKK